MISFFWENNVTSPTVGVFSLAAERNNSWIQTKEEGAVQKCRAKSKGPSERTAAAAARSKREGGGSMVQGEERDARWRNLRTTAWKERAAPLTKRLYAVVQITAGPGRRRGESTFLHLIVRPWSPVPLFQMAPAPAPAPAAAAARSWSCFLWPAQLSHLSNLSNPVTTGCNFSGLGTQSQSLTGD